MSNSEAIKTIRAWAGGDLQDDYLDLLNRYGGEVYAGNVFLYGVDDIVERNETFQVQKYCPGFLAIGDDSGGRAIVIALGKVSGAVFLVDYGGLLMEDFTIVASDINNWIGNKFEID
jgi:hypothetical protein